VELTKIARYK